MKWKTSVSLMVAVVLGLITAKVGTDMIKNRRAGAMGAPIKVVIAKKDFEAGHVLEAADLAMRELPSDLAPPTAFRQMSDVVGRTVISPVVTGQTMFEGLVAAPGSAGGIQALIPPGMRAVNVDLGEATGLANQIAPGCRVDVIATLRDGDQSMARTIVENVKVSAVTRASTGRRDDKSGPVRSVTLIVKPKEANTIELANAQGKTRLIMRGTTDSTSSDASVTQSELLGKPDPEPQPVAAKAPADDVFENKPPEPASAPAAEPVTPKRPVQIFRGSQESTIYMEQEEGTGAAPPTTSAEPPQQRQPSRQQPKTAGGVKSGGEEHRKLSGTPSDTAPRTDARP